MYFCVPPPPLTQPQHYHRHHPPPSPLNLRYVLCPLTVSDSCCCLVVAVVVRIQLCDALTFSVLNWKFISLVLSS